MNQRFFGNPEYPLFGVLHTAKLRGKSTKRAVLICPPIGQEFIRSHWCMRLLAAQLARKGINAFRMDYEGIGDSAGNISDVHNLSTWLNNIRSGIDHIKSETGVRTVMLVGLRFGATLAAMAAKRFFDVNSAVLWEPIPDGRQYLAQLRAMHEQMVDLWFCKVETINDDQHEEILGSTFSKTLLKQIESASLEVQQIQQPHLVVDLTDSKSEYSHPEPSIQKVIRVDDENSWSNLLQLETAWLRPQTTRIAVQTIDDMFNRLDRFLAPQVELGAAVSTMENVI